MKIPVGMDLCGDRVYVGRPLVRSVCFEDVENVKVATLLSRRRSLLMVNIVPPCPSDHTETPGVTSSAELFQSLTNTDSEVYIRATTSTFLWPQCQIFHRLAWTSTIPDNSYQLRDSPSSVMSLTHPTQPSSFLDLTPELRDRIYDFVFEDIAGHELVFSQLENSLRHWPSQQSHIRSAAGRSGCSSKQRRLSGAVTSSIFQSAPTNCIRYQSEGKQSTKYAARFLT